MGEAWWDTGRHGAGEVPESSTLRYTDSRKRVILWAWLEHLKPQSPLSDILPLTSHTYFNKATPPHIATSYEPMKTIFSQTTTVSMTKKHIKRDMERTDSPAGMLPSYLCFFRIQCSDFWHHSEAECAMLHIKKHSVPSSLAVRTRLHLLQLRHQVFKSLSLWWPVYFKLPNHSSQIYPLFPKPTTLYGSFSPIKCNVCFPYFLACMAFH